MNRREPSEVERIRQVYADRDAAGLRPRYRWDAPDALVTEYGKRQAAADLLERGGFADLGGTRVLDVGCGTGRWLCTLLEWGARSDWLHGTELLTDRIEAARRALPHSEIRQVDGWTLPWPDGRFDLVSAFTVFSSILDEDARAALAAEMRRVLSPGGAILVYDFRFRSPSNRNVRAVGKAEMRQLFGGSRVAFRSVTLAPPLARPVARVSPSLVPLTELMLPFLKTHLMAMIRFDRPHADGKPGT